MKGLYASVGNKSLSDWVGLREEEERQEGDEVETVSDEVRGSKMKIAYFFLVKKVVDTQQKIKSIKTNLKEVQTIQRQPLQIFSE